MVSGQSVLRWIQKHHLYYQMQMYGFLRDNMEYFVFLKSMSHQKNKSYIYTEM